MEQVANFTAATTMNNGGTLNSSTTTVTVTSLTSLPSAYPYRIRIDDELMKVTGTPGSNQLTIVRGDGGTTAASHVDASSVIVVLTAESLNALISIQSGGSEISNRRILNFIGSSVSVADNSGNSRADITIAPGGWESAYTTPVLANYTGANMGTSPNWGIVSQSGNNIFLRDTVQSTSWGDHFRIQYIATPTPPYALIVKAIPFISGQSNQSAGVCYYDSSSTKLVVVTFIQGGNGLQINKYTNPTTYSATYLGLPNPPIMDYTWFKLADDNTNRIISISKDGLNWIQIHSVSRTDFMTANAVGICVNANNDNGTQVYDSGVLLVSWTF